MKNKIFINFLILFLLLVLSYFIFHVVKAGLVSDFSDEVSTHLISSASNHTLVFDISSSFGPNDTLELYFESDFDLSGIDYTDIDLIDDTADLNLGTTPGTGTGGDIGVAISGQTITFTQNDTDTVAAGSTITIAIGLNADFQTTGDQQIYNPSIAGSYKISLSGTFGDMGTVSVPILNSDSVALEATIVPELSFFLRNETDTDDSNTCAMGTINSLGISQCSYRLAVETNAISGFQVYIKSDGNFRNPNSFIANISENNQVEQGVEGYGLALAGATGLLEQGDFTDDETPIPSTETLLIKSNSVYNYIQGNTTTSSLITHKASVDSTTPSGVYSQTIVYTVLGNY